MLWLVVPFRVPSFRLFHVVNVEKPRSACFGHGLAPLTFLMPAMPFRLTGITFPVKVFVRVTVAFQCGAQFFPRWTVRKRHMPVGNVVEKVYLLLRQHQTSSDRVHRRVAPALVEKTTIPIQAVEKVDIGLGPEPIEIANFKVGPLVKEVSYGE